MVKHIRFPLNVFRLLLPLLSEAALAFNIFGLYWFAPIHHYVAIVGILFCMAVAYSYELNFSLVPMCS